MVLSARRSLRSKPVHAQAVALPTRLLATLIDCLLPTAGVIIMIRTGAIAVDAFREYPGIFLLDRAALLLWERPMLVLYTPLIWMLMWTAVALLSLGTFRTSLGKWAVGLSLRQSDGQAASGTRRFARILATWTIPLSLGLSYLWIVISPERRGLHDSLSGTYVVRVEKRSEPTTPPPPSPAA
jgi:uncharacterized RDD family membrane protein YckC